MAVEKNFFYEFDSIEQEKSTSYYKNNTSLKVFVQSIARSQK
jgi:hypothetical protein